MSGSEHTFSALSMRALTTAFFGRDWVTGIEIILPKGVKLNLKQLNSKTEKQILCKTHRSIINCQVRCCNKIINDLKSQINKIQDKIKAKMSNVNFNNITKQITITKEKVFNTTKNHQIKKFNFLKGLQPTGTHQ